MQFNIEVNSRKIEARKGETILSALRRNGIKVPTLCNMDGLSPTGACRICVVEVEGIGNLVTSCSHPVEEGMRIRTHSTRVVKARRTLVELLLSNHPDDCLYCQRNNYCELQDIAAELNIRERRISGKKSKHKLDLSSPALIRDPAKCILCGRCVRVCDEVQTVNTFEFINRGSRTFIGTTMNRNLNFSSCIACGQCVLVCPTSALHEHSYIDDLQDVLSRKEQKVVVQFGPSITVSLAEEFGLKPGKDWNGIIVSALRKIGFDYIFDTAFGADLTVMETVAELSQRMKSAQKLPMISSCCPAWVKYAEQFAPWVIPNLSTCKSPQQMLGAIIKTHFATSQGINPNSIYSVSVMPCLAKKFEAQRVEMTTKGISDVDAVISTRELAKLIRLYGIDVNSLEPQQADNPFGARSSAGKLFATAGGTAEAVARTLSHHLTKKEAPAPKLSDFRSPGEVKVIDIKMGKSNVRFTVVNGMQGLAKVLASIQEGQCDSHYIEVMACTGGCINGGGQPFGANDKSLKARIKAIYDIDDSEPIRMAHRNSSVKELYNTFLEHPGSSKALKLLHTTYSKRNTLL